MTVAYLLWFLIVIGTACLVAAFVVARVQRARRVIRDMPLPTLPSNVRVLERKP